MIRRSVLVLAPLLAAAGLLSAGAAGPVLADARPSIVSITVDVDNSVIVTWAKEDWQASLDVLWSSGDGTVAAPGAGWNDHYGLPLVDCWGGDQHGQPTGPGPNNTWLYGQNCAGQDVADDATSTTTNVALEPGTYFFQVTVAGENADTGAQCSYLDKGLPTECLGIHYSDAYRVDVPPLGTGAGTPASVTSQQPEPTLCLSQAGPTCPPGANPTPVEMVGPGAVDLPQGGHVDLARGGNATFNPPYNLEVEFGEIHFSEDLAVFHCPSWTEPYPPEATLGSWIGVRCRTVTTPQAGALVEGTDFDVTVSATTTTFYVFAGKIEVSDLGHEGVVAVGPGQMTTVLEGRTPSKPVAFDASDPSRRWWSTGSTGGPAPTIVVLIAGLILLGFVALFLAMRLSRSTSTSAVNRPPMVSPDGRWWWDGAAWRPMPPPPGAGPLTG